MQSTTPVIETSKSQVSSTISEVSVQNLPVNGRNFIDFALLTPGVTKDVRSGDISFAGQRGTLNSLVVDGADNNNTFFGQSLGRTGSGRAPYQFSQDAVQEFQVNSNAYSAEYGRAGGAVINVVTKSGTNAVHGSGFWFVRDKKMNANDAINVLRNLPKSPYHFDQFGGTIGGPLRRDKDFFFFNYDGQRNTTPNTVFLNVPANAPTDPASLAAIERLRPLAESWERRQDQDVFLIKTDHQLASAHRLTLRYNHQNFTGQNFENGGANMSEQHTGNSNVYTRTLNASMTSVLGSRLFNEVRFQVARDREPGFANSDVPEANIRSGGTLVLTIGRNSFSPRETTIKRWQVADTITWARGAHKLKGGFDFQFDDILNFFPGNFGGSYTFNSLASFTAGTPNLVTGEQYVQAFEGPGTTGPTTNPNIQEYSFFAQDEWRLRPDLTLNLGVRYDVMKTEEAGYAQSRSRISPPPTSTPAAWTPTPTTSVRASAWRGARPARSTWCAAATASSTAARRRSCWARRTRTTASTSSPTRSRARRCRRIRIASASIPTGGAAQRPSILVVDKDFQNPRLQQASVGFDYEVMANTSLSVSYLFVKGDSLPRSIDRNLGTLGSATFTVAGSSETLSYHRFGAADTRPFANFKRVIVFESDGRIALQRHHVRTEPPLLERPAGARGVYARPRRRHGAGRHGRGAGQHGRRSEVRLESGGLRRRSHGWPERSASPAGAERRLQHVRAGGGQGWIRAGARQRLDVRRDLQRRLRSALHGARRRLRLEQRRQPAQRHRAGHGAQRIPPAQAGDVRSAHRPRHLAGTSGEGAVDLGSLQPVQRRQLQQRRRPIMYSVNGTTNVLTPTTNFGQPLSSSGPRIMQVAAKFSF